MEVRIIEYKSSFLVNGGEGGIRTPGRLPPNGFQDRRFRPLSHLSKPEYEDCEIRINLAITAMREQINLHQFDGMQLTVGLPL